MTIKQRVQHISITDEMMSLKYPTMHHMTRAVDSLLSEKIEAAQAGDFEGWTLLSCAPAGSNFPTYTYVLTWETGECEECDTEEPDTEKSEDRSDETPVQVVLRVGDKFIVNGVEFFVEQFVQATGSTQLTVKRVDNSTPNPFPVPLFGDYRMPPRPRHRSIFGPPSI